MRLKSERNRNPYAYVYYLGATAQLRNHVRRM